MTTNQLHTFLAVCDTKSFTKAAGRLYISQSAVSKQMAALETELGTALFERNRQAVQLTPAGVHLARHLRPMIHHLDGLINQVKEIGEGQTGSLIIGLLVDQSVDPRMSRALQWLRQSRNVTVSVFRYDFMELLDGLQNGVVDLAISVESVPNMFEGCKRLIYAEEHMCFAARRDLLLQAGDHIDEAAIHRLTQAYPVLTPNLESFPKETRAQLAETPHAESLVGAEIPYDLTSIAPMVSAGLAATLVNESHVLANDQAIALLPYQQLPKISKGIFWMPDTSNPLVELFCNYLRESEL